MHFHQASLLVFGNLNAALQSLEHSFGEVEGVEARLRDWFNDHGQREGYGNEGVVKTEKHLIIALIVGAVCDEGNKAGIGLV